MGKRLAGKSNGNSKPKLAAKFPASRLPIWAGINVYDFLFEQLPPSEREHLQLKWPNDVVAGAENKKICGILSQVRVLDQQQKLALGIGINLKKAPEGEGIWATALPELGAEAVSLESALERLLELFQEHWPLLGDPALLRAAWEQRTHCIGALIRFGDLADPENMRPAKVLGLSESGGLRVWAEGDAEPRELLSDDISLRF
jgi:biotin-(acetyl-CoA carboxylase) ligase